jgi:hypothetical protein
MAGNVQLFPLTSYAFLPVGLAACCTSARGAETALPRFTRPASSGWGERRGETLQNERASAAQCSTSVRASKKSLMLSEKSPAQASRLQLAPAAPRSQLWPAGVLPAACLHKPACCLCRHLCPLSRSCRLNGRPFMQKRERCLYAFNRLLPEQLQRWWSSHLPQSLQTAR